MGPFDYALGLISILVGLALADVVGSLHKLLRQGPAVKWDGRVILSVAVVITLITGMWFSVWSVRNDKAVLSFAFYLSLFLEFMVLFLVCAACLPDDAVENGDLGGFYEKNIRYLWSLFALFQISFFLHWIYFHRHLRASSVAQHSSTVVVGAMIVGFLLLTFIRSRWFHYSALVALLGYYLFVYWKATLAA